MLVLPKTVSRHSHIICSQTKLLGPNYGLGWFITQVYS